MSKLSDLFSADVSNTDSVLMHAASENDLDSENFDNSFPRTDKDFFQDEPDENQSSNDSFNFGSNPYPTEGVDLTADDTDVYPPNLEQLIQESVSRSTARLLTQSALRYLARDLMVSSGEGVSQQFTINSAKPKEPSKPVFLNENDYELPVVNKEPHTFDQVDPVPVDPELSNFKMQNLTNEMYKLFDNIKSFELKSSNSDKLDFNQQANHDHNINSFKLNNSLRSMGTTNKSTYTFEGRKNSIFESRMKPDTFPSLNSVFQEDSNPLLSNGSTQFGSSGSFNSSTKQSDVFETKQVDTLFKNGVVNSNLETEFKPTLNFTTFNSHQQFDTDEPNESRFNTAKSRPQSTFQRDTKSFPCFTCQNDKLDQDVVRNNSIPTEKGTVADKTAREPVQTAKSAFNPGFVTRVYAPINQPQLGQTRRAVVVGCNYLATPDAQLRGSCNDAFAFAQVLVRKFNFDPKNVILLLDAMPSPSYTRNLSQRTNPDAKKPGFTNLNLDLSRVRNNVIERNTYPTKKTSMFGWHLVDRDLKHLMLNENVCLDYSVLPAPKEVHPTRGNVFKALKWLNFSSSPGDLSVFFFSGHSVQVDDLSGYEGDGFDEALVPSDFELNGLVTCNDLKCLFQSIGATSRLNVFFDTCNLQTVVGGASRSGPIKGSKMKGIWPFSEPTGKVDTFQCSDSVFKDPTMINQMTRVKFLPTLQVDSLGCLSDVQMCLDATHGVVDYVVFSSSNLKSVSVECLFKPINLDNVNPAPGNKFNWSHMVRDDEVVVHGAFTYSLLLTLLYDKPRRRGGLGADEVVEGINKKLCQLRRIRLPKMNQEAQALFYHSSRMPKNVFLFPSFHTVYHTVKYLNTPFGFFLPGDAWMVMVEHGRQKAKEHQQRFERMKTDLINLSNLNNKIFNQHTARTNLQTSRTNQNLCPVPPSPSLIDVPVKAGHKILTTQRSVTNNLTTRVFMRNPKVTGRITARSRTAMNNLTASTTTGSAKHTGFKFEEPTKEVVDSHNWYGGCTVTAPINQPTWYTNYNEVYNKEFAYEQPYYKFQFGSNHEPLPVYEPITAAMLHQLPTSRSFSVIHG